MDKDFDGWNVMKKYLQGLLFRDYIKEREVWWCSLGVNIGFEEDGKNNLFERPVLILLKFTANSALIIPLTSHKRIGRYYFSFIHDNRECTLVLSQLRFISTKRLLRKMYKIGDKNFEQIQDSVCSMILKRLPLSGEPRRPEGHVD